MINTVIFDLSDVLIKGLAGSEDRLKKYKLDIKLTDLYVKPLADFFIAKISEEEYWQTLIKKYRWNISIDIFKKAVRDNFTEIEGTRKIIQKLKQKGYKLGLLSIHTKEWVEYCEEKYNYHHLFHSISYSYEVSVVKPDKESFEIILRSLKSKPEVSLFIDDNPTNIEAAKQLGLKSIQFESPSQLKSDLREMGINI